MPGGTVSGERGRDPLGHTGGGVHDTVVDDPGDGHTDGTGEVDLVDDLANDLGAGFRRRRVRG